MIINILGLGQSISEYTPSDNISFGVNDISRLHKVDYLVCVDRPNKFTEDRKSYIENNTSKKFYSHLDDWKHLKNFEKIELQKNYPDYLCDLDSNQIPKSVYSPFVAICLAWKLFKPTEIHLYGVDMNNHMHLSNEVDRNRILRHTRHLKTALDYKFCRLIVHGNGILKELNSRST